MLRRTEFSIRHFTTSDGYTITEANYLLNGRPAVARYPAWICLTDFKLWLENRP